MLESYTLPVKTKNALSVFQNVLLNKWKRLLWTTVLAEHYLLLEKAGLKPEIIVAGIPIYNLQSIGHASSDEIMKYRSISGIFLAHQKGGKSTFKFTAYIQGVERYIIYKALEALQIHGTETTKNINDQNLIKAQDIFFRDKNLSIPNLPAEMVKSKATLIDYARKESLSNQEYAYHHTFPIITPTRIYSSMYLETLTTVRDIKLGKDVLEINCAFRHYEAPTHYGRTKATWKQRLEGKEPKKNFYALYTPYKDQQILRNIDMVINLSWITARILDDSRQLTEKQKGKLNIDMANLVISFSLYKVLSYYKYKGYP